MYYAYETVSEAVNDLKQRGYTLDFNLKENSLVCNIDASASSVFDISDFEIVEVHRYEGNSDPADEAVVYAIESNKGHKGVLVTGYGTSAEGMSADMAKKLQMHKN